MLVSIVAATVLGGVRNGRSLDISAPTWRSVYWDAVPMLMGGLIVVGGGGFGEFFARLPRLLLRQSIFAMFFTWLVILRYPLGQAREMFGGPHYAAYTLISISIIPCAMLEKFSFIERVGVLSAYATFALFNVIYQSRGGFIISVIVLPVLITVGRFLLKVSVPVPNENKHPFFGSKTMRAVGAVCLFTLIPMLSGPVRTEIAGAWEATSGRLYGGAGEQSIRLGFEERTRDEVENSRGAEAVDYLHQLDPLQLAVGHGFGGAWYSEFWGVDWFIVHFGPLHLVLKGGGVLSLGFLSLVGFAIFGGLRAARRNSLYFGSAVFVGYYFLAFLKHGPFMFSYETVVFWLVLGIAVHGISSYARPFSR